MAAAAGWQAGGGVKRTKRGRIRGVVGFGDLLAKRGSLSGPLKILIFLFYT